MGRLVRGLVGEGVSGWGEGALLWRQRVVGREQLYRRKWRLYRRESSEGALLWGRRCADAGAEGCSGGEARA